jgi:tRNA modification GTPase
LRFIWTWAAILSSWRIRPACALIRWGDDAHGTIESEGIRRALERARHADIRLLVFDGTDPKLDEHTAALIDDRSITVINKCDLFHVKHSAGAEIGAVEVSVQSGQNVDKLLTSLENKIKGLMSASRDTPSLTRARHRAALEECAGFLDAALGRLDEGGLPELIAEDLRMATRALGRITGRVDVEDLLDVIFRDFCIGK